MQKDKSMKIQWKKLDTLKKYEKNVSIHDAKHVSGLMGSIEEFGWTVPILIDSEGVIIAGHGRYEAAKQLGFDEVPCLERDDWSEAQVRTYRIADNEWVRNRGRNMEILRIEMEEIVDLLQDTGENLSLYLSGLEPAFIESIQKAEDDLLADDDSEAWEEEEDLEADESVLVKMQFPASVWLGCRSEVVARLDKMSKKYLCRVKINE
jgi:hypothetical protein